MIVDTRCTAHIGSITAVCVHEESGGKKQARNEASVGKYGLEGNHRASERDGHHVLILAQESLDLINKHVGTSLEQCKLSENITVLGLGDLCDVPEGACVKVRGEPLFEVVGHAEVPVGLRQHQIFLYNRCGLYCRVIGREGTIIRPNDLIEICW